MDTNASALSVLYPQTTVAALFAAGAAGARAA
jgi:hypothetical protein